jgi:hypothetical protein
MADEEYKKYTQEAKRGIKGEAFFESLIVGHAIPHRIARQNDLGIDFLCEWVSGDRPTGILFVAQVKSRTTDKVVPKLITPKSDKNELEEYSLTGARMIQNSTLQYWKGLGLPAFVFYVLEDQTSNKIECYYKRYTPLLDGDPDEQDKNGAARFYRATTEKATFRAFADPEKRLLGFARDLIVDYVRLSSSKGQIIQLIPTRLGFWPFPTHAEADIPIYFPEFVRRDREKIRQTVAWVTQILDQTK